MLDHPGELLETVWENQRKYNQRVQEKRPERSTPEIWTKELLLGMMSEVDELLREIQWKGHRNADKPEPNRRAVAYELADLTKYVLSLWQVWGFDLYDMLKYVRMKNKVMDFRLTQEFMPLPAPDVRVLVVDIDNTLGDFTKGFCRHIGLKYQGPPRTLNIDVNMNIDYREYRRLATEFAASGGFANLPPIMSAIQAVRDASFDGAHVIVCTARPVKDHPYIWYDTYRWLELHSVHHKQLYMGAETRIELLMKLADNGNKGILFDDNPDLTERALNSGLKVYLPKYEYNRHLWDRANVVPVDLDKPITLEW